ncbi:hypothetical protein DIPPA_27664 [Diplonema papillatum]|nr:hypothetical protein DIPPA_02727 [Diplonema papillatum]KAJ9440246.1 hypothetical protein DIPPA_00142 [Diplonema papillatum]KAJ9445053.1 hypothetical protein DIPPA_27664 [Diplonema papillatum]
MTIAAGSSGPQVENGEEIEMPEVESEDDGTVVSRSVASTTAAGGAAAPGGSVPAHDPTLRGEILGLVSPYTMAGSHDLNKTLVAEDGSLHHANRGCSAYPLLPETRDVYQLKWAQKRMAIENDGVASASVQMFYSSALQLCISIGLFVLGCTQLPDGDFTSSSNCS